MWWAFTTGDGSRGAMILACAQGAGIAPLRRGQGSPRPARAAEAGIARCGTCAAEVPCRVCHAPSALWCRGVGQPDRGG
jgi:hypothetical protein